MRLVAALAVMAMAFPGSATFAQEANPLSAAFKSMYDGIKRNLLETADVMPADKYGFRPTPGVRTFGEMLAHVADRHYRYCALAKGEENPVGEDVLVKTKTAPADIKAALRESYAYCDEAYGGMTDARALETITMFNIETVRARALMQLIAHDNEEYGNLVPYLRMNDIVPPSTARQQR